MITGGRVTIEYNDGDEHLIDLGAINNVTHNIQKTTTITPIVSLDAQSAFPIEGGNSQSYTISFTRHNPLSPNNASSDTKNWSNAYWYDMLSSFIDRWQTRTNGCYMTYTPEPDNPYVEPFRKGGFIKSITRTYDNKFNEVIRGTLQFTVGTMYVNSTISSDVIREKSVNMDSMYVMMSNPECTNWYVLGYGGPRHENYMCISSLTVSGGSESPIQEARLRLSKRKLVDQIPELYNNIVGRKNRLIINAMGTANMIVNQVSNDGDYITIVAYATAYLYKGTKLGFDYETGDTPMNIILDILRNPDHGLVFADDHIMYRYRESMNKTSLRFSADARTWYVLSVCAYTLGCKLFFADNNAYIVDYTVASDADVVMSSGDWNINMSTSEVIDIAHPVDEFGSSKVLIGKIQMDMEGADPLGNIISVDCTGTSGRSYTATAINQRSIDTFGEVMGNSFSIPELLQTDESDQGDEDESEEEYAQGMQFAENYLRYTAEPQRSVRFTYKEIYNASGSSDRMWHSFFGNSAMASGFEDTINGDIVTNRSVLKGSEGEIVPQKLVLSSYTRHYPQGYCDYTFGVISNIDLSEFASSTNMSLQSHI